MDKITPEHRSWLMGRVRSKNTKPELKVRRLLFAMGYRYRLHRKDLPGCPDIVFPKKQIAIFINGCFWHGHTNCKYSRLPSSNVEFWKAKIEGNRLRDSTNTALLEKEGWRVITIWQCEIQEIDRLSKRLRNLIQNVSSHT
ncbi:TPA: DNA mismatch endonuclease Vsr [Pseudomonas aeruginosa]|nr:DNA mismatch endonuclease Vsr [Pseudomonas aeruginosa]HBO2323427.1 DNA mismatch endonuclease Vsr [Pseudomonas aeruginosa]